MSQDSAKTLTGYDLAIESFEHLESLFHTDQLNVKSVIEGLHICHSKIEHVISEESMDSSYLVDLFQLKRQMMQIKEMMEDTINRQRTSQLNSPQKSISRVQKEKAIKEKAINIIQNTIETPRANGLKDIAGLWEVKKVLKSLIVLPQKQPQLFVNHKAFNSVLLFGPPGTGKTRLVHALASEANATLHSVFVSDMLSPLVGQTEKNLQKLFEHASNTENLTIVFIDEVDGICRTRHDTDQDHSRRLKTELMCQMSNIEGNRNMFLICATNCPWDLDTAFLRRFQKRMYIPLPNYAERHDLFQLFTKDTQLENSSHYWEQLIDKTEGFSGSDLSDLVQCALNIPIIELEDTKIWKATGDGFYEPVITAEDFSLDDVICCELSDLPSHSVKARSVQLVDLLNALDGISATVNKTDIKRYEVFNNR